MTVLTPSMAEEPRSSDPSSLPQRAQPIREPRSPTFLLGYPAQVTGTQLLDWARMRQLYFGTYIQDDWKVSRQLTINIGLRYELYTQPVDARNRGALFNAATGQFAVPGQNGFSRSIVDGHPLNFAPRLGFAYSPSSRWTFRGGAGLFYGPREQNQSATVFGANPPNAPTVVSPASAQRER